MEGLINLGIPHIGEKIFEHVVDTDLIQFRMVSKTWKELAENILTKRWSGKVIAACAKGRTEIVQILLDHSERLEIDWNQKDCSGWTAFMWACSRGQTDVVKLLLHHSTRINIDRSAKNNLGMSAFSLAFNGGHQEIVKLLENEILLYNKSSS